MSAAWTIQTLLTDMRAHGDRDALVQHRGDTVETWSYARLAEAALQLACGLRTGGLAAGEPVLMLAPNSPSWIVARLALGAAGALPVHVDHLAGADEIAAALGDRGCRWVFTTAALMPVIRAQVGDRPLQFCLLDAAGDAPAGRGWGSLCADATQPLPSVDPDSPAMRLYTSGTTGRPKSFALSYANLGANLRAIVASRTIGPDDRVLLPLPLHHVYPLLIGLLVPLQCGATVILPEAVTGPEIARALDRGRATVVVGVPRLYAAVLDGLERRVAGMDRLAKGLYDALMAMSIRARQRFGIDPGRVLFGPLRRRLGPDLRLLVSGGAKLESRVLWRLVGLGWTVRSGYGLAETASTFTGNLVGHERLGSEGRPFQGGELRIADPGADGIGEIQLRGPNVFAGYCDDPAANRDAFTADGWFRTGDLGRLDEAGFLYVTGRLKEMIVLGGGKNVFPEEVERTYGVSPYIRELAVLERDGALVALIVPDLDAIQASGNARVDDVLRIELAARGAGLAPYQRLAGFAVQRAPLPRTRLGKYQRFLLPDLYAQARAGAHRTAPAEPTAEDRTLLADPRVAAAWRLLNERYPDKGVAMDAHPQLDLGIDSLEWMALALELERRLGVRLGEAEMAAVVSVRDLLGVVAAAPDRPAAVTTPGPAPPIPRGSGINRLGRSLLAVNRILMRGLFGLRVVGVTQLPDDGPFVLVPNHASDLDPAALAAALPSAVAVRVRWGADSARVFGNPVLRSLARAIGAFSVDERLPAETLDTAAAVLAQGDALVWFPESWRSPDGRMQEFRAGIGALLIRSRVPAVPVHIAGTFEAMPRDRWMPRLRPIRVRIGRPIGPDEYQVAGDAQAVADLLRERVSQLVGEA